MKIAYTGLDLPEGKIKYNDKIVTDLAEKLQPGKVSPYYFEFLSEDYETAEGIAISSDRLLDLLILDIEKIERRVSRSEDPAEKEALGKCLTHLENEKPICDLSLSADEQTIVKALAPLSFKGTVVLKDKSPAPDEVCRAVMKKAGMMFFYTAAKQEVHAWIVEKGADAVTCAGKIHTDLARGFIKAELVSYEDMMTVHGLQDARSKGLSKLVDGDYVIEEKTVVDVRFNV
jgi:ribosome-binding ATPase YchF (GTP1/OBG family)